MLLVIAHSLNSIRDVDQLVVVQDGQVLASGSHQELLKHSPEYQHLVNTSEEKEVMA